MRFIKPYPFLLSLAVLSSSCGGGSGGSGGTGLLRAQVVTTDAIFPTALRFLPNGDILFTEKNTGNVRKIVNGAVLPTPVFHVDVNTGSERGLLGLAIDPDYATNGFVYIFYTKTSGTENEVLRFTDVNNIGTSPTPIVPGLPGNAHHDGGRLEFGPDGKLYVTLGDVENSANAQSDASPAGKVLRYNSNGTIPADNPIAGNPLYAKGLRNSFGLAIDPASGTVFASENGSGCGDELNRVGPNGNYGWPIVPCGSGPMPGFVSPLIEFPTTIAPTGLAVGSGAYSGSLLMGSFVDDSLRQFVMPTFPNGAVSETRIRYASPSQAIIDVTMGPDGNPYIATAGGGQGAIIRLVP